MDINHWQILILGTAMAEGNTMWHCTVLLIPTFASGFTTETNMVLPMLDLSSKSPSMIMKTIKNKKPPENSAAP
jgi:hypothetical protein